MHPLMFSSLSCLWLSDPRPDRGHRPGLVQRGGSRHVSSMQTRAKASQPTRRWKLCSSWQDGNHAQPIVFLCSQEAAVTLNFTPTPPAPRWPRRTGPAGAEIHGKWFHPSPPFLFTPAIKYIQWLSAVLSISKKVTLKHNQRYSSESFGPAGRTGCCGQETENRQVDRLACLTLQIIEISAVAHPARSPVQSCAVQCAAWPGLRSPAGLT